MNDNDRGLDHDLPSSTPTAWTDADLLEAARRGTRLLDTSTHDVGDLWEAIAAEAFEADDDHTPPRTASAPGAAHPRTVPSASRRATSRRADRPAGRRDRMVRSPERRRRRTFASALVGVAVAVLAVVGVSWIVTQDDVADLPVATFRMDPLDERVASGVDGQLVTTDEGQAVQVDLGELPAAPAGTFYEVWLLDLDAGRLVSLGPVDASGTYAVPAAVADATWPTIDVSVEPVDGDPTHSSDSVLRGPVVASGPTG